jgi:protein-S-isoprenylcysteine O-methyltransferase Ste14
MALGELSVERAWVFVILVSIGNALDVWSYAVLCRSISIVAEARELVTRAPYRWIRHPVYLGQIIAQSAIWVVLPRGWSGWWVYFAVFVALQLYRSRIEERVLESAFGDAYRAYRRRAVWFWP